MSPGGPDPQEILSLIDTERDRIGERFRDDMVAGLYARAASVADAVTTRGSQRSVLLEQKLDRILTHPFWGIPSMLLLLGLVFYLTILGANIPSAFLAGVLIDENGLSGWLGEYLGVTLPAWAQISVYTLLHSGADAIGAPWWLSGLLIDGIYLCMAWVVSVMLPPMAIFFPMFTLLEDLGYLPRIAFNLDWLFKRSGAHGKQALTMAMGFGCNAAGVTACRIIDSPREKLIAILTNNFMICNGRFPTVIALASVMIAASVSTGLMSLVAALTVVAVILFGVLCTFIASWLLSRTMLKGEASAFTLELPPYRRPSVMRVIYTSMIDRTLFVLGRAVVVAAPAGIAIWLVANINIEGQSLASYITTGLEPLGWLMGLDGVILLAYIIAIPANEIVVPTILMLYMASGKMIEEEGEAMANIFHAHGWSLMTVVCLLLFIVLHNPCGTTIWTIYRETKSKRWTAFAAVSPVILGIALCMIVANVWRLVA